MQKKIFSMLMVLFAVCAAANAATVWNPAANTNPEDFTEDGATFWHIPANWTSGVPDAVDGTGTPLNDGKAVFNVANAAECIVNTPDAICNYLSMGDNGNEPFTNLLRIVDGGTLTTRSGWSTPGYNRPGTWIIEEGGTFRINGHMWGGINDGADGTIYINGGEMFIKDAYDLGRNAGAKGTVYLNEGLIQARYMADAADSPESLADIRYGTFRLTGGESSDYNNFNSRINKGTMVGFAGFGTLNVEKINNNWTVTANDPLAPSPEFKEEVFINDTLELSWTNLPAAVGEDVYVDVWFGTDPEDPNSFTKIVDAQMNVTNTIVDASALGTYYWRVDSYLNGAENINDPNKTEIFQYEFTTTDDLTPVVTMITEPTLTWAGQEVDLLAVVTDTGTSPIHIEWSWPDDPNVIVDSVVITETEPGVYEVTATAISDSHQPNKTITLTAYDEKNGIEKADSDTVQIDFARDACQGARGGFMRLDLVNPADFDADCVITLADFAVFAAEWLISPEEGRNSFELLEPIVR